MLFDRENAPIFYSRLIKNLNTFHYTSINKNKRHINNKRKYLDIYMYIKKITLEKKTVDHSRIIRVEITDVSVI